MISYKIVFQGPRVDQLFCRTPLGIGFYDYWYAPFISVGLEPQKQATDSLREYETLVDFAW